MGGKKPGGRQKEIFSGLASSFGGPQKTPGKNLEKKPFPPGEKKKALFFIFFV